MRDSVREIVEHMQDRAFRDLAADRIRELAVSRLFVVLGATSGRVTAPLRAAHPEIPWAELVELREALLREDDRRTIHLAWPSLDSELPKLLDDLDRLCESGVTGSFPPRNRPTEVADAERGTTPRIEIPSEHVAAFCRRHSIRKLSLFGSVLRGDFGPESDIDVLVEFEPNRVPSYFGLFEMEDELSEILGGRTIEMRRPQAVSKYWRVEVLAEAVPIYVAPDG
jgi:hypothetical protein